MGGLNLIAEYKMALDDVIISKMTLDIRKPQRNPQINTVNHQYVAEMNIISFCQIKTNMLIEHL